MNKKVFCSECRHYVNAIGGHMCHSPDNKIDTWYAKNDEFISPPYEKNRANDCELYEERKI